MIRHMVRAYCAGAALGVAVIIGAPLLGSSLVGVVLGTFVAARIAWAPTPDRRSCRNCGRFGRGLRGTICRHCGSTK